MKEVQDRARLRSYLEMYQLGTVFDERLQQHLSLYSFEQGELICSQGDPANTLYVLVKGKVKIYTTSAEGKTLILSFKNPLDIIGDIEYVQGIEIINTVEAVSSVDMIGIPHRWLVKYAQDYPPFLQFLLKIITQKFFLKSNFLSFNLMHPVEVRLASYLLSITYDDSDSKFEGQLTSLSLKDAANLIGTSYRHLNRVIQKFCAEGLIERSKGSIKIIDRKGLSELASLNIYEREEGKP
ncbi:Crp/Fnr family transcriptional regulator [Paenibacillus zeisoli]|uniref:Crp/Fnr family transcriptional regulator n=1 Tax=Paenibacillus zeisoli TaxID=2496267 RepID=A0A433XNL8_9BACL|nr:Crp/Fnr family transcriptional regulator [Paenibacillus zeisoli]RUT35670.1 Crp/Fnr family transcriptional regulator [Paenibacillus zeisoli]